MKSFSSVIVIVLGLALTGAGCGLTRTIQIPVLNSNISLTGANTSDDVSYAGQDGKNVLELLQQNHSVDVSAQGFVNAIDGHKPGDHEFWAYYVDGVQAAVGAKDYQSKTNETIVWKLESF